MAIIVLEQRGHKGQDHSEPQQVHQQRHKHNQQCPVIDTSLLLCDLVNTLSVSQISLHLHYFSQSCQHVSFPTVYFRCSKSPSHTHICILYPTSGVTQVRAQNHSGLTPQTLHGFACMVFETFKNVCYMQNVQVKGPLSFLYYSSHTCYWSCS